MSGKDCPPQKELTDYISGKIVPPRAEEIDAHLDSCPRCHETLDNLQLGEDQMTAQFRKPAEAEFVVESACDAALEQVVKSPKASPKITDDADQPTIVGGEKQTAREIESSEPTLGQLREYELLEKLGEGGMGAVYKARHSKLGKIVALKILPSDKMQDAAAVNRFEREMRAVGSLNHPHIVGASDAGEFEGQHYLVMEYVAGIDLSALVKQQKRLRIADACELIRQAALGLEHVHEIGLVHRDIKPSNIMLTTGGQVKVLDLGLALLDETHLDAQAELTTTGQIMGTVDYMAPEQGSDTHSVDIRADLYSLGATLFKLLTGKAPFQNKKYDSMIKRLMALANEPAPPVTAIRKEVPEKLANIIAKLLAKDPAQRFQTPAELAAALEPFCEKSNLVTLMGGETIIVPPEEAMPLIQVAPTAERNRRPPRRKVGLAMWGFFAAVLLGVITIATKEGTITIKTPDNQKLSDAVQVKIKPLAGGDKEVTVLDKNGNWTASLASGEYTLDLVGGNDEFDLTDNTLSVSRFGTTFVEIAYTPKKVASGDAQLQGDAAGQSWHGWPADAPAPAIAPFSADQAKKHQEAWAKYLGVPVEYKNSIGMKFRLIPPGEFLMGSTKERIEDQLKEIGDPTWRRRIQSEAPQHKVVLSRPLYVGMTEVTQAQYEQVMRANPSHFSATGEGKDAVANQETLNHPVEMVSWNEAVEFCATLSQLEKLKPFHLQAGETLKLLEESGYRLPTEAEWEYVCRAGTTTRFWSGDKDNDLDSAGWFRTNSSGRTHAAGELTANPFGLSDMHGNVWEWVQDGFDPEFYGKFTDNTAVNPLSSSQAESQRMLRGGDCSNFLSNCRSSYRRVYPPSSRHRYIGFRAVLPMDAVNEAIKNQPPAMANISGWPADSPPRAIAPFDADQAKKHQEAWAKYLDLPVVQTFQLGKNQTGEDVSLSVAMIPPSEFMMGSPREETTWALEEDEKNEIPGVSERIKERMRAEPDPSKVIISKPYALGVTEVTVEQYQTFLEATNYRTTAQEKEEQEDPLQNDNPSTLPMTYVTLKDASAFCNWLSRKLNRDFRIPTEAEWENACRAGTTTRFGFGDDVAQLEHYAWFDHRDGNRLHPVGLKRPNYYGLFDMHGNSDEWALENSEAGIFDSRLLDPDRYNQTRGGTFKDRPQFIRSGYRRPAPSFRYTSTLGFRVLMELDSLDSGQALATEFEKADTPLSEQTPSLNHALSFDGVDDYVELPFIYDGTRPLTVEVWGTPSQTHTRHYTNLVENLVYGNSNDKNWRQGFAIQQRSDGNGGPNYWGGWIQLVRFAPTKSSDSSIHIFQAPTEEWTLREQAHLVLQIGEGRTRFFLNGKQIDEKPISDRANASSKPFFIGKRFMGQIDEVRFSNTMRYRENFTPKLRSEPDKNTLALYHFDEGKGDVLKDSSRNEHHGKIHGATWVKAGGSHFNSISENPERELAEWVIEQGGKVTLEVYQDSSWRALHTLIFSDQSPPEQFPPERFRVFSIDLKALKAIDDDAIRQLRSLCHRKEISILQLDETSITDEVSTILAGMRIHSLSLKSNLLSDRVALQLPEIRGLSELNLSNNQITDTACALLDKIENLSHLSLMDTSVSDEGVKLVAQIPNLHSLELIDWSGTAHRITDQSLVYLAKNPSLERLFLQGALISDAGLKQLENSKLTSLGLGRNTKITSAGVQSLSTLDSLVSLNLNQVEGVNDRSLESLEPLPELTNLMLMEASITDAAVPHLLKFQSLTDLQLQQTKLTNSGIERLRTGLPHCRIINIDGSAIEPVKAFQPLVAPRE